MLGNLLRTFGARLGLQTNLADVASSSSKNFGICIKQAIRNFRLSAINSDKLEHMHRRAGGPYHRPMVNKPIHGFPSKRGVVLKVEVRKPRKPQSGNRKVVVVRLTNGSIVSAYVPGEGHNLQEHSVVMVEGKGKRDLQGVYCHVVRGKLDCAKVVKKVPIPKAEQQKNK